MTLQKRQAIAVAALAICGLIIPGARAASNTAPNIIYTATGTFSSIPVSGADQLKLAGEPFTVKVSVNAAAVPYKTGAGWAAYNNLDLTGKVYSALSGPTPIPIQSAHASLRLAIDPNQYDQLTLEFPTTVTGISITIDAVVELPYGTFAKPLAHPFSAVALSPAIATLTYFNTTESTVLTIASGSVSAVASSGSAQASARKRGTSGLALGNDAALTRRIAWND